MLKLIIPPSEGKKSAAIRSMPVWKCHRNVSGIRCAGKAHEPMVAIVTQRCGQILWSEGPLLWTMDIVSFYECNADFLL